LVIEDLVIPGRRPAAELARSAGPVIVCDNLVRIYKVAELEVVALQGLDLVVEPGEMIAIVGASGSGKSTLLNILGGLDSPTAGRASVASFDLGHLGRRARTRYRREVVGVIWQQTTQNLLPYLDALENVELPMAFAGSSSRSERATALLHLVGLGDRIHHRPEALSGGEQQRVAIAVALANRPAVLLADEPTGELDSLTSADIFEVLRAVNAELGTTIVIVTHDPLVSEHVARTVAIRDGRTSSVVLRRTERAHDGEHRVISEEFAVLDRAGRLQLPRQHLETLGLVDRVRLVLEDDHVEIWPSGTPAATGPRTGGSRSGAEAADPLPGDEGSPSRPPADDGDARYRRRGPEAS
jgi:ABC-type lipoprotein export system ATPase subunit